MPGIILCPKGYLVPQALPSAIHIAFVWDQAYSVSPTIINQCLLDLTSADSLNFLKNSLNLEHKFSFIVSYNVLLGASNQEFQPSHIGSQWVWGIFMHAYMTPPSFMLHECKSGTM